MVGEGPRAEDACTYAAQCLEEFLRPSDAGKGENGASGKSVGSRGEGACAKHRSGEGRKARRAVAHEHERIGARKTVLWSFAQRARGDQPAIAQTEFRVDDDKGDVLGELEILEAVVHHD